MKNCLTTFFKQLTKNSLFFYKKFLLMQKKIVITGGSSGIGLEIVKICLKKHWLVFNLSRHTSNVEHPNLKHIECDLEHPVDRLYPILESARKEIGNVDVLINNAGVYYTGDLDKQNPDHIEKMIRINLMGTIYTTRVFLPTFKKQNYGTIINISSAGGTPYGGKPGETVYMSSKYGVSGFTEGLKKELINEGYNIRVMGFYPATTNTNLFKNLENQGKIDTSKFMHPKDIAEIIFFMITRPNRVSMDYIVVNRNKCF